MFKPNKHVIDVDVPHHGGMDEEEIKEYGYSPGEVIDFSASLNPFGPPEILMEEIWSTVKEDLRFYPESNSSFLREKIADKLGLSPEKIIVTAGMSELIDLVARTYVEEGTDVVIPEHTYGEYEPSSELNGAEIRKVDMPGYELKVSEIIKEIREESIVFLCNPNNPTGDLISNEELNRIIDKVKETGSLLVIDEAYHDFIENPPNHLSYIDNSNDLMVMRTFTKAYNIPGIRIGYGVSNKHHIQNLLKTKIPWNVGDIPQRAIESLLTDKADLFMEETRQKLLRNKDRLLKQFRGLGFETTSSKANFITIDVEDASDMRTKLLKEGIIVRDCSSFGMPRHIRVAVRKKEENKEFIEAFKKAL